MVEAYVGVDVAFAKRKVLPVSICTWKSGRLVPFPLRELSASPPRGLGNVATLDEGLVHKFACDARSYVEEACGLLGVEPVRIAIDAPSAPCLERSRRAAERAMDQAGISCFATPTAEGFRAIERRVRQHLAGGGAENRLPHANQLWMIVGFALFEELARLAPCLEVFPQATACALGAGGVHKFKSEGIYAQLAAAAGFTGWPTTESEIGDFGRIAFGPAHDRLDAYLAAWVAALEPDERRAFGNPPDDVIWVPRLDEEAADWAVATTPDPSPGDGRPPPVRLSQKSEDSQLHSRNCPACGDFRFSRWPFGWDSHAAHRCDALTSVAPSERKKEFKQRFRHLFRNANT